ncbi:MAG: class II aldolase/adducin family protein [Alphaproteobacteria bacterium]|nr:class II aldolase/adducin family protein [Alphaproteobacteria bacterium]
MDEITSLKNNLTIAYQALASMKLDNMTYTHLSARLPGKDSFYIYPFGFLYSEVTPSSLLHVSLSGDVLEGKKEEYNPTGYALHSAIYKSRPDINAIFHLHTTAGVSVSAMECGLLPISQFALHFYNRVSYQGYDSLVLDPDKQEEILKSIMGKDNKTIILRNHGTVTCGSNIQEAFFFTHHLEEACKVQCLALNSREKLIMPNPVVCEKSCQQLLSFEKSLGERDWKAISRQFSIKDKNSIPYPFKLKAI